jgi:hypothetical protein
MTLFNPSVVCLFVEGMAKGEGEMSGIYQRENRSKVYAEIWRARSVALSALISRNAPRSHR